MIKFNLGGGNKSNNNSNNSTNTPNAGKSSNSLFGGGVNLTSPSMPNLSGINKQFSNITKKMGEGLSNIPTIPNLHNTGAAQNSAQDKKAKDDAQERKDQIAAVIGILEDVNLQCPSNHSGLILAYTGRNMSPIMSPGIKFTWFRMRGEESVEQIEETTKSWYSPSIEDIGAMICVQCEDSYEQGFSKYLECGPLKADPLLKSLTETAVNSGSYEAKEIFVSIGLSAFDSSSSGAIDVYDPNHPTNFPTSLSKDHAFVQLNGQSTIEVDENGIFISIPTMPTTKSKNPSNAGAETTAKSTLNTGRRGLRIPANGSMKLVCVQPSSIVLSIPVKHKTLDTSTVAPDSPLPPSPAHQFTRSRSRSTEKEGVPDVTPKARSNSTASASGASKVEQGEEDEKMRQFLTSSILAIPWTYEGHSLSPAAYISENESRLSPEERERLLKAAEEDSIIFANTVVLLAEFISSVPENTEEILICFSCSDKLIRDILALTMRLFTCFPAEVNRYDRISSTYPWLIENPDDDNNEANISEGEHTAIENELKKRLMTVEEENASLKRERNELTLQLLEKKEEISLIKAKGGAASHGTVVTSASAVEGDHSHGDDVGSSHGASNLTSDFAGANTSSEEGGNGELSYKELSAKIIELENKLNISNKKELEATKARSDAEGKNSKLSSEVDRLKRVNDDLKVKVNTLQVVCDRQSNELQQDHEEISQKDKRIKQFEEKLQEDELIISQLQEKVKIIDELKKNVENLQKEITSCQEIIASNTLQRDLLKNDYENKLKSKDSLVASLESQVSQKTIENKKQDIDILQLREQLKGKDNEIIEMSKYQTMYKEELSKNDQLSAQINHLIKKSESQTRDLKKTMADNAVALAEFEKALIRKSEECNDLYFKINAMKDAEAARLAAEEQAANNAASNFINKISTTISTGLNSGTSENNSSSTHNGEGSAGRKRSGSNAAIATGVNSLFRRFSLSSNNMNPSSGGDGNQVDG